MKKIFLWFLFIAIIFFLSTKLSNEVHAKILFFSDSIKIGILNFNHNVGNFIQRHFNQVQQIKQLTTMLKDKQDLEYKYKILYTQYQDFLNFIHAPLDITLPDVHMVRTISYVNINDYSKIWLDFKHRQNYQDGTIFGLIDNNKAAGIAIFQNGRLMGYLNNDEKLSYSVVIGNNKSPGIAKYDINKGFIVDYIPLFPKITIGELVYTSGFDQIFYPGLLVGVVKDIEQRQGYQIATIKPASDKTAPFYWLVDFQAPSKPTFD